MAFCLLDATAHAQATTRLAAREDDPRSLLVHHHAFAEWMRRQASDPMHMLEVVTTNGWRGMRWDRVPLLAPQWAVQTIDTTELGPHAAAEQVKAWICGVLAGTQPSLAPALV
ncbi:MAG: hypothetical protein ACRDLT_05415 [Solirubrobacteraceae bacterium]